MPQDYYSLVTDGGLIKEAASNEPGGTAINLTEIAVGDGGGVTYDPVSSATALANEVYRIALTHVVVDENNPNQLIVEGVLDETIGPFYIREVGIFDSNGDLFAIGKYPETFKPNLPSGSGKRLYIRMILGFANAPNVNLVINNDIALDPNFGTDVNNALAERLIKTNNLSDLDDVADARNNLSVHSKEESNLFHKRNYIINGNFDIWQRASSFLFPSGSTGNYCADRWSLLLDGPSASFDQSSFIVGQQDVPSEPRYYATIQKTSDEGNNSLYLIQKIENVRTLSNKQVTISFYAKADVSRNVNVNVGQVFGSGGSASVYQAPQIINLDTSWQKFVLHFNLPSISGKIIGSSDYLELSLYEITNDLFTWDIAQVQLEEGSIATQFSQIGIGEQLITCQRYYEVQNFHVVMVAGFRTPSVQFRVLKRSVPITLVYSRGNLGGTVGYIQNSNWNAVDYQVTLYGVNYGGIGMINISGYPQGEGVFAGSFMADAEL
jgi:hypothetical protein